MAVVEGVTSGGDWRRLSSLDEKWRLYARDPHFRESMWDARRVLGPDLFPVLHQIALLVVKPEALAGRRVDRIMGFAAANDFTPVQIVPFSFTRHVVRELWRYQWNAATIEKMGVADRINCALPTAVLLLRDDRRPRELPAAVRMKSLKGAATPEEREPGSLRGALAAPNRMTTFVHSADEPADVVRELGIFFDRPQRQALLADLADGLASDLTGRCHARLKRLEAAAPETDFDPDAAWQRILSRASGATAEGLALQRDLYASAGAIEWWRFLDLAERARADEWDVVAICAAVVEHEDPGQAPRIAFGANGIERWRSGEASLCPA